MKSRSLANRFSIVLFSALIALAFPLTAAAQGKIAFTSNFGGNNNIWLMNSNGTNQVALTTDPASDAYPNLSHDGTNIVFQSDRDGNLEIYSMNAAGAFQTRLTNDPGQDTEPVFSPDGSKIVFATNRHGTYEIYIMNSNGTGLLRLTTNSVDDGQAEFSPDGTKIIFSRLVSTAEAHIYTMDLNGGNQVPVTSGSFVLNGQPSYSPNGQKIVFSSVRPLSHTNPEIYLMDANGANQLRVTTAAGQDLEPVYSPNGSKIAFRSERDGNAEIYIMDANGGNQQRITFGGAGGTNFAPSWADVSLINVDMPDDLVAEQNTTLTVPVLVSDTTNKGAISYDFVVDYDPAVLQPLPTPFSKAGTLSANFEVNAGGSTPGRLVISGFGTVPLSGAGTLLLLRFNVIGTPPVFSDLIFESFTFNEGIPFSELSNGQVFISGTIRGRVTYGTSPTVLGVPAVQLIADGTPDVEEATDLDGNYVMSEFGPGAYTVTPSKNGDNAGINALDASLVSQFLVGITPLNVNQQAAAEVSGNGTVTSFDAALIAQYVAEIANPGRTGQWRFLPPSRGYATIGNLIDQNYTAILLGEVSGNWVHEQVTLAERKMTSADSRLAPPNSGAVTVSLQAVRAKPGQVVTIPVYIKFTRGLSPVQAYQFDLLYDSAVIQPELAPVDTAGTTSSGLSAVSNAANAGRLRVVVYGSNSVAGSGTLLNLKFRAVGRQGSSSALRWQGLLLNEGTPTVDARNGSITVRR